MSLGRREFMTLAAGALIATPWNTAAHQVRRIGVLCPTRCTDAWVDAFRRGLKDLSLIEGINTEFLCLHADGNDDRLPKLSSNHHHSNRCSVGRSGESQPRYQYASA